jgi:hypothetical protein
MGRIPTPELAQALLEAQFKQREAEDAVKQAKLKKQQAK